MDKKIKLKDKDEEIISLNPELFPDLSITELEDRLEMSCIINYGCGCNGCQGYICNQEGCETACTVEGCVGDVCGTDCGTNGGGTS